MTQRPAAFPDFCTGNPAGMAQPSSAQQSSGYVPNEAPAAEHENWLKNTTAQWLRYLDEQGSNTVLASSLDFSTRLIGGGSWSYNGTTLAWSQPAYIAIPSAADGDNTIPAASLSLPAGSLAYVTANMPFSTTANTASGSAQLTNVLYGDQVGVGQLVFGPGIPANVTVKTVSADGQTITLSQAATATASAQTITFRSSGTLTPQVAVSSSFVPGPNTIVFARGLGSTCLVGVGSGQMLLRGAESKALLGQGYSVSKTYTAGVAIGANVPVYLSPGASLGDAAGTVAGSVYPLDCTSTSSQVRATFLGIAPVGGAAGASIEVVQQGITNGWSITPGLVYFGSATQAGVCQEGPPTSSGQWVMPLVLAVSATQAYILPRNGATQVPAVSSYKSMIDMGYLLGKATGSKQTYVLNRGGNDDQFDQVLARVMPFSGSILSITPRGSLLYAGFGGTSDITYVVTVNGTPLCSFAQTNEAGNPFSQAKFAKGTYTFAQGDVLRVFASITNATNAVYGLKYVDLGVEFTP